MRSEIGYIIDWGFPQYCYWFKLQLEDEHAQKLVCLKHDDVTYSLALS